METFEFDSEDRLEAALSEPSPDTRRLIGGLEGDIVVLGAAGKMGPTLCLMLKKAAPGKTIHAVSRFSDARVRERLEAAGIRTAEADLADRSSYGRVPQAANVYFLAGMKFGASRNQELTWALNAYLPALVAEHFAGSRIVALSTGNVYPFVPAAGGGALEDTPPDPRGEYAQSCLGRERIFQYFSRRNSTPVALIRLSYANEPRYGVIVDLIRQILAGEPVDLSTGHVNLIWQADANDYIARSIDLAASPAAVLNVTGPELVPIRQLAEAIGRIVGREVRFTGREEPDALLINAGRCFERFGYPRVPLPVMVRAIVRWVAQGKRLLDKPTKFQVRSGQF
jgi:nucleoside-diphosphate-sugar epimerase